MTPAVAGPQWMPMRSRSLRPPSGGCCPITSIIASASRPIATAPSAGLAIEPCRRHVAVADGLDLFDAVLLAQRIEGAHQAVEESRRPARAAAACATAVNPDQIGEHHAEHLRCGRRYAFSFRLSAAPRLTRHHRRSAALRSGRTGFRARPRRDAARSAHRTAISGVDRDGVDHGLARQRRRAGRGRPAR